MGADLPGQVQRTVGQPATVRIGTVTSLSPLTVSIQGADLNPASVGVAANINPMVGSSVTLLGQSKASGSDPASWLIVGMASTSPQAPMAMNLSDGTDIALTATVYVSGTPSPICGVSFTAPPSGMVRIDWHARFETNTVNVRTLVSTQVAEGAVLDAGTVVSVASDASALENHQEPVNVGAVTRMQAGMWRVVSTLTPGVVYNAVVKMRNTAAGTGSIFDRSIMVTPM